MQMPKTDKQGRNIFIKTYKRRPQNKKKRAAVMAKIAVATAVGAMNTMRIISQPIPKYTGQ